MLWDIFCRVIDNYGDLGVCWRLSADLAARGHSVRLWVDDASALHWMAPGASNGHWPGIQVLDWNCATSASVLADLPASDVWIEGFGCNLAPEFVAHFVQRQRDMAPTAHAAPTWINLEYLSAEAYVERCHGLPSPIMSGAARGWQKFFFYPGFTVGTGGLLREHDLLARSPECSIPTSHTGGDANIAAATRRVLHQWGVTWHGERLISLFCYAPALLPALLRHLAQQPQPTLMLATHGKAQAALQNYLGADWLAAAPALGSNLRIAALPALSQTGFDDLLRCCDLNFVRGEDSLVRAIWAGKPFVWNIYPQDDNAHADKLNALLQRLQLGQGAEAMHQAWNGLAPADKQDAALHWLCTEPWTDWQTAVQAARARLAKMNDLTSALVEFVQENR